MVPARCSSLKAQGVFSNCVMVATAAQTALWWSLGQRRITTLVRTFKYLTACGWVGGWVAIIIKYVLVPLIECRTHARP